MNIYCHIPEYQMYKNHGMLSMIPHFIKLDMVGICPEKGHWFKVHTASPGPTFSCRTRLSIHVHGTAQGQAKQIHSGMICIHSPVVQLQTDDKNFHFIGHLCFLWFPFRHVRALTPCSAPKTTWTLIIC